MYCKSISCPGSGESNEVFQSITRRGQQNQQDRWEKRRGRGFHPSRTKKFDDSVHESERAHEA